MSILEGLDENAAQNRLKMAAFAASFHVLRGCPGVDPWDPDALDAWAAEGIASPATLECARCVLAVWNPTAEWQCGRFDVIAALTRWDAKNRAAFIAWATSPWWP